MKKPYHVVKYFVCGLTGGICLEGKNIYHYSEHMPKPECEKCERFIEAFMKKYGLKKKERKKK